MPQKLLKDSLSNLDRRVLVVTILGQQSTGKSTLLNFLFGCDFSASVGRCTKGIYGTYYEVKDQKIRNFDIILVLDT